MNHRRGRGPRAISTVFTLILLLLWSFFAIQSCVIRIGPPDGPTESDGSDGGAAGSGGTGGEGGTDAGVDPVDMTTEEDALSGLESADPVALGRAQLRSQYAAYALAGFVDTNAGDPALLDDATLDALIDDFLPIAWQQAQDWVDTLDPGAVPLAQVKPKYECEQQSGCTPTDSCKFDGYDKWAYCVVTGCGDGACPGCPDLFDLSKLVVKSWCSYTCMVNKQIVGIKIALKVALFGRRARCLQFEKPIPCEGTCGP